MLLLSLRSSHPSPSLLGLTFTIRKYSTIILWNTAVL